MSTLNVQGVTGLLNITSNTVLSTNTVNTLNLSVNNIIGTATANTIVLSNSITTPTVTANTITSANATITRISAPGTVFLSGNTTALSTIVSNIAETTNVYNVASTGTINYNLTDQSVLFSTVNATANFTLNLRGNATTTLDSLMANGQTVTVAYLASTGFPAFFSNTFSIDGFTRTVRWQNSIIPTAGNANSIDSYAFTVIKTSTNTYTVFGTQTQFK